MRRYALEVSFLDWDQKLKSYKKFGDKKEIQIQLGLAAFTLMEDLYEEMEFKIYPDDLNNERE